MSSLRPVAVIMLCLTASLPARADPPEWTLWVSNSYFPGEYVEQWCYLFPNQDYLDMVAEFSAAVNVCTWDLIEWPFYYQQGWGVELPPLEDPLPPVNLVLGAAFLTGWACPGVVGTIGAAYVVYRDDNRLVQSGLNDVDTLYCSGGGGG